MKTLTLGKPAISDRVVLDCRKLWKPVMTRQKKVGVRTRPPMRKAPQSGFSEIILRMHIQRTCWRGANDGPYSKNPSRGRECKASTTHSLVLRYLNLSYKRVNARKGNILTLLQSCELLWWLMQAPWYFLCSPKTESYASSLGKEPIEIFRVNLKGNKEWKSDWRFRQGIVPETNRVMIVPQR